MTPEFGITYWAKAAFNEIPKIQGDLSLFRPSPNEIFSEIRHELYPNHTKVMLDMKDRSARIVRFHADDDITVL